LRRLKRLIHRSDVPADLRAAAAGHVRILNLACGECHESKLLGDVFSTDGENVHPAPPSVELVGLDVRAPELARARLRDTARNISRREYRYIDADASRYRDTRQLPGDFELVFLRHQNFWNGAEVWKSIFSNGLDCLAPQGRLVITSYFHQEHRLAVAALEALGATLLHSEDHTEARVLNGRIGKRVDGHIAVFQRPD
jgi:hypothetical protein